MRHAIQPGATTGDDQQQCEEDSSGSFAAHIHGYHLIKLMLQCHIDSFSGRSSPGDSDRKRPDLNALQKDFPVSHKPRLENMGLLGVHQQIRQIPSTAGCLQFRHRSFCSWPMTKARLLNDGGLSPWIQVSN